MESKFKFNLAFTELINVSKHGFDSNHKNKIKGYHIACMGYIDKNDIFETLHSDCPEQTLNLVEAVKVDNYELCILHTYKIKIFQKVWRRHFYKIDFF